MKSKNVKKRVSAKKISEQALEKLHIGDLLLYRDSDGKYVIGWVIDINLKFLGQFCSVQWSNKLDKTYIHMGDVLAFHEEYKLYRESQGIEHEQQ